MSIFDKLFGKKPTNLSLQSEVARLKTFVADLSAKLASETNLSESRLEEIQALRNKINLLESQNEQVERTNRLNLHNISEYKVEISALKKNALVRINEAKVKDAIISTLTREREDAKAAARAHLASLDSLRFDFDQLKDSNDESKRKIKQLAQEKEEAYLLLNQESKILKENETLKQSLTESAIKTRQDLDEQRKAFQTELEIKDRLVKTWVANHKAIEIEFSRFKADKKYWYDKSITSINESHVRELQDINKELEREIKSLKLEIVKLKQTDDVVEKSTAQTSGAERISADDLTIQEGISPLPTIKTNADESSTSSFEVTEGSDVEGINHGELRGESEAWQLLNNRKSRFSLPIKTAASEESPKTSVVWTRLSVRFNAWFYVSSSNVDFDHRYDELDTFFLENREYFADKLTRNPLYYLILYQFNAFVNSQFKNAFLSSVISVSNAEQIKVDSVKISKSEARLKARITLTLRAQSHAPLDHGLTDELIRKAIPTVHFRFKNHSQGYDITFDLDKFENLTIQR